MGNRVLFTAACLLSSCFSLGAADKTTIHVSVRNQRDKPVENAAVILDFLGSHDIARLGMRKPTHWEVKTNGEGIARFPPIPGGTIQLQVIANKYETFGGKFDVDGPEKTFDVKLNNPQKQYSVHGALQPKPEPVKPDPPKQ